MPYMVPEWLQRSLSNVTSGETGGKNVSPPPSGENGGWSKPGFNSKSSPDAPTKPGMSQLNPEVAERIRRSHATLQQTFASGKTRDIKWRKQQLKNLKKMILENEKEIFAALNKDLGKGEQEAWLTETAFVVQEVDLMLKHIDKWCKPEKVGTNMLNFPSFSRIYKDPLGAVLIISPWNYPINLLLVPLVGAIAGGNTVCMKPSEIAGATADCIARLVPKYLDRDAFSVVTGGVGETTTLLEQEWQLIFYTGSGNVGRKVMSAAAKHLTPVILELGGKSPTYVSNKCNIEMSARRIMWGKFTNAGQTCVAPDYLLVHRDVMGKFLEACKKELKTFYQSKGNTIDTTKDYGRIVNDSHFKRLSQLLRDSSHQEAGIPPPRVFIGGEMDPKTRFIAPTILTHVVPQHKIMEEEIFGPILPILTVDSKEQAVDFINSRDKPLAMYIFSSNSSEAEFFLKNTSAGGVVVNDTLLHLTNAELPFGGVGPSGMGGYHGIDSLKAFTHQKAVLKRPSLGITDVPFRYPPYSPFKKKMVGMVLSIDKLLG